LRVLNAGCCGVAGSFGYEHYDLSMKIGEQRLLPAVRDATDDALIVADGFSCRSQISHGSSRQALHPAQVLQLAIREGRPARPDRHPPPAAETRNEQAARTPQPAPAK
jgi:Fe-S oxidoreductase